MSDISQSNSATVILNPGESFKVSTSGTATVTSSYGAPAGSTTVTAQTTQFGPYDVPAKLRVVATSGPCSYWMNKGVPMERNLDNTLPAQEAAAVLGASSAQATAFTSRAMIAADNGGVFYTSASQAVTINTGVTGLNSCVFYGPVTFTGTATIDDKRTTGADTDVAMVQRLPGADSFRIIGGSV